jgi:phytanoyl-CoA hydroxylase
MAVVHDGLRVLTREQAEAYERDGFLVLPGFIADADCDALRARAAELVDAFDPTGVRTIFTTNEQTRVVDDYFLGSGDDIRFFFEEGAFGPDGELVRPKELSLNKFGHAMHDLDPVFDAVSRRPQLADLVHDLGLVDPLLLQSMYIFKQPGIGGEVGLHQDATFLWTDPLTVVGLWFALEDATLENGCLWALPGGHREAVRRRFHRDDRGGTVMDELDPEPIPRDGEVPLEVTKGTVIVLHGLLPHRSDANTSPRSRHAYTLHVIERGAAYPADNWLQRKPEMPLRGF